MRNVGLDESQVGIKIARRKINNLRYSDDMTLMAESKEELKNLMMRVKEESKNADLKLNIQKMKIMASSCSSFSFRNNFSLRKSCKKSTEISSYNLHPAS